MPDATEKRKKPSLWRRVLEFHERLGFFARVALWILLFSPVLAIVGYKVLRPVYKEIKRENSLAMAERYMAAGDMKAASLAFRKAVRVGFRNVDTWQRIGVFLDQANSADLVSVHARIAELRPADPEARFDWVGSAIRFNDLGSLQKAIESTPESMRGDPRYLNGVGNLRMRQDRIEEGLAMLHQAVEKAPDNEKFQFDWNAAKLRTNVMSTRFEGIAFLEEQSTLEGEVGLKALRTLIMESVRANDLRSAGLYAAQIIKRPDLTIQDRLLFLEIEVRSQSFTLPISLKESFDHAEAHPDQIPALANFLIARGQLSQTLKWLQGLPPDVLNSPGAKNALMDALIAERNWSGIFELLSDPAVNGAMEPEVAETVKTARSQFQSGDSSAIQKWQEAVVAVQGRMAETVLLSRIAEASEWRAAEQRTLWSLVEMNPSLRAAWRRLVVLENVGKNLPSLQRALNGLIRADPGDTLALTNWVFASILLENRTPGEVLEAADRVVREAPEDSQAITARAMALLYAGQSTQALEAVETLESEAKRAPARAFIVASIYAANGKMDQAREYLTIAEGSLDTLLPEEVDVYSDTIAKVEGRSVSREEIQQRMARSGLSEAERGKLFDELRSSRDNRPDAAAQEIIREIETQRQQRQKSSATVQELLRGSSAPDGESEGE